MSTLYRPVLIESAEQAAQMPEGTLARHAAGPGMDHAHKARPLGRDLWLAVGGNCTNAEMVGWTALVPIEVEAFQSEPLRTTHLVEGITGPGPFTVYVTQGDDS